MLGGLTQRSYMQAYKKLSLLYHPDKTAGLTKEDCLTGFARSKPSNSGAG